MLLKGRHGRQASSWTTRMETENRSSKTTPIVAHPLSQSGEQPSIRKGRTTIAASLLFFAGFGWIFWNLLPHRTQQLAVESFTESRPPTTPGYDAFNERAVKYLRQKAWAKAVEQFSIAIQLKPDYYEAYVGLGRAYCGLKNNDLALHDFERAIAMRPAFPDAFTYRGLLYQSTGDDEKAIADLSRAITLSPDDATIYKARAESFMRTNQFDKAVEDYKTAQKLDPSCSDCASDISRAQAQQERYKQKG